MWKNGRVTASEIAGDAKVSWHVGRLIFAWALAAVIGIVITIYAEDARFSWLVLAVGVSVLISFALQLGTAGRAGFITRLAFSIAGSVLVIAVIDVVVFLLETFATG